MKSLIIYFSNSKNTEKIAEAFAKKINADLVDLKKSKDITIDHYDLIGFGSGVYKESMATPIFNCVEQLNLEGKETFVFSTSGLGMKFYNNKLIKILEAKGAKCKGSFACKGSYGNSLGNNIIFKILGKLAEGHPNDKDISKAEMFIKKVK